MIRLRHKQRGMTLLELLVATGILAVVSGLALMGIQQMTANSVHLQVHEAETNQTYLAQYLMLQDVQMAWSNPKDSQHGAFIGDSASFSLQRPQAMAVSSVHLTRRGQESDSGVLQVKWSVKNQALVRSTRDRLSQGAWVERVMMPVTSMYCEYRNVSGQIVNRWPNTTLEQSQLPRQLRCTLRTKSGAESMLELTPWEQVL